MSDNITIPGEALEAAAASICRDNGWPLSRLNACIPVARDACIAMLRNWPGMHIHEWQRPWLGGMSGADIILPLTESGE